MQRKETCELSGFELRKAVARANGWYSIHLSDWKYGELDWGGKRRSRGRYVTRLPDWTTDVAAAFELVKEMNRHHGVALIFDVHARRWKAMLGKRVEVEESVCTAICRLYVAYKKSMRESV
jgi:hypothetical protein